MKQARVVLTALCLGAAFTQASHAQENRGNPMIGKDTRSIAITATDRFTAQADTAVVHVGYVLYGPDREAAYATGSQASNAIKKALLDAGVAEASIESQDQSLSATDEGTLKPMTADKRTARTFTIRQSWTVRVEAKDANRALDVAVHAGANDSGQIEWSLRDANAAQATAATKAIQRARTQAQAMATGLNVKLGTLLYASNEVNAGPGPMPVARMMVMDRKAAPPLSLNPQQIETSATVYAVFAIE